jgi:hypothetical protein
LEKVKISEARLREIVLEEVADRLIDYEAKKFRFALREECARKGILLTEAQEDKEIEDWKKQKRRDLKTRFKKGAAGLALAGTLTALGAPLIDAAGEEARANRSHNVEQAANMDSQIENLEDRLFNVGELGSWAWNAEDSMPRAGNSYTFPTHPDDKMSAMLPLEWSVGTDVLQDMENDVSRWPMSAELQQILAQQPEITSDMDALDIRDIQKDFRADANAYYKSVHAAPTGDFFTEFASDDFKDAGNYDIHGYTGGGPHQPAATFTAEDGSQSFQDILYVSTDSAPSGYVLDNGLTIQQQYEKLKYVDHLPLENFVELIKGLQK